MMNMDEEEKMTTDELFQSMILQKSIRKFDDKAEVENSEDYNQYSHLVHVDGDQLRKTIPSTADFKIKPSALWKLAKDCIGKDLSKFAMPVFINEPCSILQKAAEFAYYCQDTLPRAASQKTSIERLLYICAATMAPGNQVVNRLAKPFNPMLGETFELVTPKCRYIGEMVCHHPPIYGSHCQGENWEYERCGEAWQSFNGKVVTVTDPSSVKFRLHVKQDDGSLQWETFTSTNPIIMIGNLFIGERYCELHGVYRITHDQTGEYAQCEFKPRGMWSTKSEDK